MLFFLHILLAIYSAFSLVVTKLKTISLLPPDTLYDYVHEYSENGPLIDKLYPQALFYVPIKSQKAEPKKAYMIGSALLVYACGYLMANRRKTY